MISWEKWDDRKLEEDGRNKLLFIRRFGEKESEFMEKGVFGRKGIETLSNSYMPVRVDADERPDIFRRYGLKYTPTVMLLTKDGRTLGGGNFCDYETFIKFMMEIGTLLSREREIIEKYGAEEIQDDKETEIELREKEKLGEAVNSLAEKFSEKPILSAELLLTLLEFFIRKKDEQKCRRIIETLDKIEDKVEGGIFSGQLISNPLKFSTRKTALENAKYGKLLHDFSNEFGDKSIQEKAQKQLEFLLSNFKDNGFLSRSISEDDEYYKSTKGLREIREKPEKDKRIFADTGFEVALYLSGVGMKSEAKEIIRQVLLKLYDEKEKKLFHSEQKQVYNLVHDISLGLLAILDADKDGEMKKYVEEFEEILLPKKGKALYFDFDENGFGFLKKKKVDVEANINLAMFFMKAGKVDSAKSVITYLTPFLEDNPAEMLRWWSVAERII